MTAKKDQKEKAKGGRPSKYTPELAEIICKIVATNPLGLPRLCAMFDEMPNPDTIRVWRWEKAEFSAKYAEAKRFQAELMAESIDEVYESLGAHYYHDKDGALRVDSGLVAHARLMIDSKKWMASKLAPKIYGDKMQSETTVVVKHEDALKDLE